MLLTKKLLAETIGAGGVTFVGKTSVNSETEVYTLPLPVGTQEGDMCLLVAGAGHKFTAYEIPTGFMVLQVKAELLEDIDRVSYIKYLDAADITADEIVLDEGNASQVRRGAAAIFVFHGAGIPNIKAIENTGNDATLELNAIDTVADSFYVGIGGLDDDKAVTVSAYPTSFTDERFIQLSYRQNTDYSFSLVGAIFKEDTGTTVTGESFTVSLADEWYTDIFEIPPYDSTAPVSEFLGEANIESVLTIYTYSSQALGDVSDNRHILVGVSYGAEANRDVDTVSVDGISAIQLTNEYVPNLTSSHGGATWWMADLSSNSNTSGDIVITGTAALARTGISLYSLDTGATPTVYASSTDQDLDNLTLDVNVPANAAVLFGCSYASGDPTLAHWVGMGTSHATEFGGGSTRWHTGAMNRSTAAETPKSIELQFISGTYELASVIVME